MLGAYYACLGLRWATLGAYWACLGLRWATWAGVKPSPRPPGWSQSSSREKKCLSWLTLGHIGPRGLHFLAKRYISRHRVVLAYVGPHWAKRVTFLGTAPGPGGHVGCILGLCWLTLSHMGGPSWPRGTFLATAPGPGGHVGCILGLSWLTLGHMGRGQGSLFKLPPLPSHNAIT